MEITVMTFALSLIFCFSQAQQFIVLFGLSFCHFTSAYGVLCPRPVWALASSLHLSTMLNVFGLMMIKTTSQGVMGTLFIMKHVSFVIRPTMFQSSVNAA